MKDELFTYHKNALLANLCKEWDSKWNACRGDKEKLVRLVLNQQSLPHFLTFCHQGNGVSKDYILEEFGDFINGNYTAIDVDGVKGDYKTQMFVGFNNDLSVADDVLVTMYSTIPLMEIVPCKASKIYCGCDSELHIVCGGYNSIIVMLFDSSTVWLDDIDENSSVLIYRYSKDAKVEIGKFCLSDNIRLFDKELRL